MIATEERSRSRSSSRKTFSLFILQRFFDTLETASLRSSEKGSTSLWRCRSSQMFFNVFVPNCQFQEKPWTTCEWSVVRIQLNFGSLWLRLFNQSNMIWNLNRFNCIVSFIEDRLKQWVRRGCRETIIKNVDHAINERGRDHRGYIVFSINSHYAAEAIE